MTNRTTGRAASTRLDDVMSALSAEQRRAVVRVLVRSDEAVLGFDTLVDRVAGEVQPAEVGSSARDHRRRVRTELHHVHLPKLAEYGMVVHDTERMQVRDTVGELEQELLRVTEQPARHD